MKLKLDIHELHNQGYNNTEIARLLQEAGDTRNLEAIRKWVAHRLKPEKPSADPYEDVEAALDAMVEKEKEQLRANNQKRIIAELSKKAAITEMVIEKCQSAISVLPPLDIEPIYPRFHSKDERSEEEVILDISDIQAGTKVDGEGTGGLTEFNWGILESEFDALFKGAMSICKRQMELAPIRKLNIFNLGDMVEGWDIFTGQPQNIDQDIYNQVFRLVQTFASFTLRLLPAFDEIEISCIAGNHGRVGKRGENPHWVNWDNVFYRVLEIYFKDNPRIKFNIPKSWYYIKEIRGWKFLLQHGDSVKGWGGIPFYGIDRAQKNSRELLETIDEEFDYIEMGHLHTPAMLPLMSGGFITVNGCWPGGSILSLKDMNKTSKPIQWIKGIHPEYGMTWCYPIYLNGR